MSQNENNEATVTPDGTQIAVLNGPLLSEKNKSYLLFNLKEIEDGAVDAFKYLLKGKQAAAQGVASDLEVNAKVIAGIVNPMFNVTSARSSSVEEAINELQSIQVSVQTAITLVKELADDLSTSKTVALIKVACSMKNVISSYGGKSFLENVLNLASPSAKNENAAIDRQEAINKVMDVVDSVLLSSDGSDFCSTVNDISNIYDANAQSYGAVVYMLTHPLDLFDLSHSPYDVAFSSTQN